MNTRRPPSVEIRFAVSGSAGCGRSTLAAALADRLGLACIPELYKGLADELRLARQMPRAAAALFGQVLETRLARQAAASGFVADGSPLDLLNLWLHCGLGRLEDETATFRARCVAAMGAYDRVIVPPWGALPPPAAAQDGPLAGVCRKLGRRLRPASHVSILGHASKGELAQSWARLTEHSSILGLTATVLPPDRIEPIPAALPPADWLEFVLGRV